MILISSVLIYINNCEKHGISLQWKMWKKTGATILSELKRAFNTCDLSTSSVPCWLQVPTSYGFVQTSHWVGCSKLFLSERGRRVKKPQEEKLLFHFKVECVWGRKGKLPDIEHPLGGEHGRWLILKLRRAFVQWKTQDLVFPSSGGNARNSKKVSEDSDLYPICF